MRYRILLAGVAFCWSLLGQGAKLDIKLDHLAAKAERVVNVNLEGAMLEMGRKFLALEPRKGEADAVELVEGLQGIYVRSYHFAAEGAYTAADVEAVKKQLSGTGWTSFVSVSDQKKGETVGVYSYMEGGKMMGTAVLSAEPLELTVVNIVGPMDIGKLGRLQGKLLGMPDLGMKLKPVLKLKQDLKVKTEKVKRL